MKNLKLLTLKLLLIFASVFVISCTSNKRNREVVFIEPGGVVRTGPDVRGHVYYLKEGEWKISDKPVKLPEGWYATGLGPED
jgi:hypothetical protein